MTTEIFPVAAALPANTADYLSLLLDSIAQARRRFWASIFIVDTRLATDLHLNVRQVMDALDYARWRGVDVRLLLGRSAVEDIATANRASALALAARGVAVRVFGADITGGTHSKYFLADDARLAVGSHNWTEEAFCRHINSAILLHSADLVEQLADKFLLHWERSEAVTSHA